MSITAINPSLTGKRLHISATLSTMAQLVSVTKTPDTLTGHWKSLVPNEYWVTSQALAGQVQGKIAGLVPRCGIRSEDVIILRLMPTTEADKQEFDHVLEYLLRTERPAHVSHAKNPDVDSIYLVPASKTDGYPDYFPKLHVDLLPPTQTEDVLFLAIIFRVAFNKQAEIRDSLNESMKAVSFHHDSGLASMRRVLLRNPLRVFGRVFSTDESHLAGLSDLPLSNKTPHPELQVHGQDILRFSYTTWYRDLPPSVDGVGAPKWAFVLGRVGGLREGHGLLVVDIQDRARSVWLLRHCLDTRSPSRRTITLISNWFPRSFYEWEMLLPSSAPPESSQKCLKDAGLKVERCAFP